MALNFEAVNETMGKQTVAKEQEVRDFAATLDPNSSLDLIKFQQKISELGIISNLQSTTNKSIRDYLNSILQKM